MSEEEQEKLYDLLFKDTKNKIEEAIEKLRIANAELRDELDKKNSKIEEQQNKIASLQKEIKLMKSININDNYINKEKVKNKIKELENLYKDKYFHLDYVKEILQELLEE